MTREEVIKEAIDYVRRGQFSFCRETFYEIIAILKCFLDTNVVCVNYHDERWHLDEKSGKFYVERLFDQWEPEPTPYFLPHWIRQNKPLTCRSLL